MDTADSMQRQMGHARKEYEEILRKQYWYLLRIKNNNTVTEMKNEFDGFISRWNMAWGSNLSVEDISINTSKSGKQTEIKDWKNRKNIYIF